MPNRLKRSLVTDRVLAALILVQILFGMNYIFSKIIMVHFPPMVWASLRAIATALVLIAISLARRKLDLMRGFFYYRQLILFSLLGVALNQGLFLLGLHYTTATNSALVNTLIPIFTVLIVVLRGQETVSKRRALGFLFAFVGVMFIHKVHDISFSSKTFHGDLLVLLNTVFYSLFLSYSHRFFEKLDYVWSTTWLFIYGAIELTLMALPSFQTFTFVPLSAEIWLSIMLTVLGATVLPYILISYTLGKTHSSVVALFVYIQPLVAAVLSFFFMGEEIPMRSLVAGALICLGVVLATSHAAEVDPEKVISLDFEERHTKPDSKARRQ